MCACVKYFNSAIWLFMVLNSGRNFTFSLVSDVAVLQMLLKAFSSLGHHLQFTYNKDE